MPYTIPNRTVPLLLSEWWLSVSRHCTYAVPEVTWTATVAPLDASISACPTFPLPSA